MKSEKPIIGNQRNQSCHLAGVSGVGMSALARVLLASGADVSGSDRCHDAGMESEVLDKLCRAGLRLTPQDGSGVIPGLSSVIFSSAVERDNPDLIAANRLKIPIVHRADMLADLARGKKLVAVAGTSGKTTVTGMIGWILEQAGADPTVVNGGSIINWHDAVSIGNTRLGRSDIWVIEVDESDRSLMRFEPDWVVVTNISRDHFDVDETKRLFNAFALKAKLGVVGCLAGIPDVEVMRGFKPKLNAGGSSFEYGGNVFHIPLPGAHNAENALQSVMLCEKLGVSPAESGRALSSFKGIHRRLERVGATGGITVFDDHAHNPAKIRAAWLALAPFHKRIVAVWRPHGYGPLAAMADELAGMFAAVMRPPDLLYIMPVYFAGGTVRRTVDSEMFVGQLNKAGLKAGYVSGYDELRSMLPNELGPGDAVLFMGARDPEIPVFVRRFLAELGHFLLHGMS